MNERCTLDIWRSQSGYVFVIKGRGTMRESPTVRQFVCGALQEAAEIVLDLAACEYLDSTFLGCLLILHERAKSDRGTFKVLADESVRQDLLRATRLDQVLDFADQRPACIGEPVRLPVSEVDRSEFREHLRETHQQLANLGGPSSATFQQIADQLVRENEM